MYALWAIANLDIHRLDSGIYIPNKKIIKDIPGIYIPASPETRIINSSFNEEKENLYVSEMRFL